MTTASRRAPSLSVPLNDQGAMTAVPTVMDWQPYESALSWLERIRALLEDSGGWTAEDQLLINESARALLVVATTPIELSVPTPEPSPDPTVMPVQTPVPAAAPKPSRRNGHPEPTVKQWSLNERLLELGYPEDVDRGTRIKLGQAVVEAYKQKHGKAPVMINHGHGEQGRRVSMYVEADLPMLDEVIREMLGGAAHADSAARHTSGGYSPPAGGAVGEEMD